MVVLCESLHFVLYAWCSYFALFLSYINTDRPRRSVLFRHLLHPSRFWRERICPMNFCLNYILSFRCPPPSSDFGDERVKSMGRCAVVLSRSVTLITWTPCVCTHADYALVTLSQRWLNSLSVHGISDWLISKYKNPAVLNISESYFLHQTKVDI